MDVQSSADNVVIALPVQVFGGGLKKLEIIGPDCSISKVHPALSSFWDGKDERGVKGQ